MTRQVLSHLNVQIFERSLVETQQCQLSFLPAVAPVVDAPLCFSPLTPTPPPPPPPPLTPGPPWTDRGPGENALLAVGPARGDTHSWFNKAEQRRAGFIVDCAEADRGRCSGQ